MQTQPKSDALRPGSRRRARQAALLSEDAFKGGIGPIHRLPLKAPWLMGSGRLWEPRRHGGEDRD